jgi:antitoxin (DNA-binding transcriptional repressor) of toxin-antitoxin stability system
LHRLGLVEKEGHATKFVSIREFRNNAAAIRKALAEGHDIVMTANGKPFAIMVAVDEESFERVLDALRKSRMNASPNHVHGGAKKAGARKLTIRPINAEIAKARREMRSQK